MPTVRICNFVLTDKRREDGSRLLATFDVKSGGWRISGCHIVLLADGRISASPPRHTVYKGTKKAIWIMDAALCEEFTRQALRAYRAATGEPIVAPIFDLGERQAQRSRPSP